MNKIAVQTGGPEEAFGTKEAYRHIKEWGFDAVDANVDHLLPGNDIVKGNIPEILIRGGKDCMELFSPWKEGAEETGLENYQAHAPFPSCKADNALVNSQMIEVLKNTIRGCDYINCRNLIVHPFKFDYDNRLPDLEEWEYNIERYSQLIPVAKEYGVTVCLENMFSGFRGKIYASCCSEVQTAARYVDELNRLAGSDTFGFCLDTGHALLCGLDIKQFIVTLGKRLRALHIHDNNGMSDQHLVPYMGVLDWKRFVEGLKTVGYEGALSFETFNVWNQIDHAVMDNIMRFICDCGRMFAERANSGSGLLR